LDIAETFVARQQALVHTREIQVLDLPGRVVAPDAPPHEAEIAARQLTAWIPGHRARENRTVIDVPPVWNVETNRTESCSVRLFRRDDLSRGEVEHRCRRVVGGDESEDPITLTERFERPKEVHVVPVVRGDDMPCLIEDVDSERIPTAVFLYDSRRG